MAAYMVVFVKVHERGRFIEEYGKPTAALVAQYGGEYLVRAPTSLALEGGAPLAGMSSVISKWKDREAIERFWNSAEYQTLKARRQALADAHVLVVEDPS